MVVRVPRNLSRPRRAAGTAAVLVAATLVAATATAAPTVDCSDPANLCTGDPCEIPQVQVLSPCVVDFGAVDLVVRGRIDVPNGGVLSFTAGSITARDAIIGRHQTPAQGDGADVTLIATGNIVARRIDVSGRVSPGSITLQAGADVELERTLRAAARGQVPSAPGGTITIDADGSVSSLSRSAKLDIRGGAGGKITSGGQIDIEGATGVVLEGKVMAAGSQGGTVAITSGADLSLEDRVGAKGETAAGGSVSLEATGAITLGRDIGVAGRQNGGTITVDADGAATLRQLDARSLDATGGTVLVVASAGPLTIGRVRASGENGGFTIVGSGGTLTADDIDASGAGSGGQAAIGGNGVVVDSVDCSGDDGLGGHIFLNSQSSLEIETTLDVRGADGASTGGTIDVMASGALMMATGSIEARSGGEVRLTAAAISGLASTRVQGRPGEPGGLLLVESTSGDIVMSRHYEATGNPGGTIQVEAASNLTAAGDFEAASGGCIGLAAGGTVDTTGGTFDTAVLATCGASPSGAFLDGMVVY